jgi:hypothetical protein
MNIYVVVEGDNEKEVYPSWVPEVNSNLTLVNDISEIVDNNYAIISGGGYPQYLDVIDNAILDVNDHRNINKLVISVDSEDMTKEQKYQEISDHIQGKFCIAEICIVIQHFCLEAWALGNRMIIRKKPSNIELRNYLKIFNVKNEDPELLPAYNELTRAQFALKYLHKAINDLNPRTTYSKKNPRFLMQPGYFNQLSTRLVDTGHIGSFQSFLDAFV